MRIILRPGHGDTPPATKGADYSYCERGNPNWSLQRPGNKEDLYVAEFCEELIPALVKAGHEVVPLRAMDPVTGELDRTMTTVGPAVLPHLEDYQEKIQERWKYNAAVEGALQNVAACKEWDGYSWSFDPVAACQWEALIPSGPSDECYLSIHQNWWRNPKMFGCGVFHYRSNGSTRLGKSVYASIADAFKDDEWAEEACMRWGRDRVAHRIATGSRWGCYKSGLWELRKTRRRAVLVELAFASNYGDAALMRSQAWRARMCEAIANGL